MRVEQVMQREVIVCRPEETVADALERIWTHGVHFLPVVDAEDRLLGAFWNCRVLEEMAPEYICELGSAPFVPDIGALHRRYRELAPKPVVEVMDPDPVTIEPGESLLAAAAAIVCRGAHAEYALVVDEHKRLLGLVSATDVLRAIAELTIREGDEAP